MDVNALNEMLRPPVEALGFELWGVEYSQGRRHGTLRIYIDHKDGISIDQCAQVSHQISGVLDVEDPISNEYDLKISSPGMDRPLFSVKQFELYKNAKVKFRLYRAIENRRNFTAQVLGVEGDTILVKVDKDEIKIPFPLIDKARIEPEF